ncbi:FAD-binding oxidoreductase [Bradyrhizobium sp. AUGA SZCCT0222]|uniref:FAD-binding oxidoreductase n=1 Tax=Bradyrhizobium sp. AUGA SZCCT0222 TaxID=2807668 RepID=UPI001BA812F9|nr:FAD-binding oxidoreductase [Bradyrhizobium sp. AUGA SZCCT0222]MBR1270654.1 FAD-binding oxidoreductase [Bradyrhizobium sp. AUGA SZCCT0222]
MGTKNAQPPPYGVSELSSFDRSYRETCQICQPDRWRTLETAVAASDSIARGAGLSYVAASFGDGATSIDMRRFNRFVGFDQSERWVEVEAGISLGKLYSFLAPRGLYLAVQPGHPQITVGGCIAGNVHGKNQFREGIFQNCVLSLKLFHPSLGYLDLSRKQNPELFELTCGGFGLTGLIVSAKLRVEELPAQAVSRRIIPVESLLAGVAEIDRAKAHSDMAYAWFDLANSHKQGRGYVARGTFLQNNSVQENPEEIQLPNWRSIGRKQQAFGGLKVFNRMSLPLINRLHYRSELNRRETTQSLFTCLFPTIGNEIYYDGYGRNGFIEQQVLVPELSVNSYVVEFTRLVRKSKCFIPLMTLKAFRGDERYLDYNGTGYSFAIDLPQSLDAHRFLNTLDEINVEHGAKTNLLKDSRLSTAVVERQYPHYGDFKRELFRFDPARRFRSALSHRLSL